MPGAESAVKWLAATAQQIKNQMTTANKNETKRAANTHHITDLNTQHSARSGAYLSAGWEEFKLKAGPTSTSKQFASRQATEARLELLQPRWWRSGRATATASGAALVISKVKTARWENSSVKTERVNKMVS